VNNRIFTTEENGIWPPLDSTVSNRVSFNIAQPVEEGDLSRLNQ